MADSHIVENVIAGGQIAESIRRWRATATQGEDRFQLAPVGAALLLAERDELRGLIAEALRGPELWIDWNERARAALGGEV